MTEFSDDIVRQPCKLTTLTRSIAIALAPVLLTFTGVAGAQTAPDAGQLLRELQPPPSLMPPPSRPGLQSAPATSARPEDAVPIDVKTIRITGNTVIATDALHALVADLEHGTHTLADLSDGAARLSAYYRDLGYPVAHAYLPPQEIQDGELTIAVVEGRLGVRRLDNHAHLSDARVAAYLSNAKDGEVIAAAQVDRGLLLLGDTPGVGAARATLQPGASVGTTDLLVDLQPDARLSGSIDADNYGGRYTGQTRLGGTLNVNSPLNIGDVLSLNALTSGGGLTYGRASYQLPAGGSGLRVGAAYAHTRYELGRDFGSLDAHGIATSTSLFASYPFVRSETRNLSGTVSLERKLLSDRIDAVDNRTDKRARLVAVGLAGARQDGVAGGGVSSINLTATFGELDIASPEARFIDALTLRSAGGYAKLSYAFGRVQRMADKDALSMTVYGQRANTNLDSSEKFYLGGASGVRAYPQGEGSGDDGYLASIEWRHDLSEKVQGTVSYDVGGVRINHAPFDPSVSNNRTLSGAGFGVNLLVSRLTVKASVAWRTRSDRPVSVPASAVEFPTFWMMASWRL